MVKCPAVTPDDGHTTSAPPHCYLLIPPHFHAGPGHSDDVALMKLTQRAERVVTEDVHAFCAVNWSITETSEQMWRSCADGPGGDGAGEQWGG